MFFLFWIGNFQSIALPDGFTLSQSFRVFFLVQGTARETSTWASPVDGAILPLYAKWHIPTDHPSKGGYKLKPKLQIQSWGPTLVAR